MPLWLSADDIAIENIQNVYNDKVLQHNQNSIEGIA